MRPYGNAAVRAVALIQRGECGTAPDGWKIAVKEQFPNSESSRAKSCPKSAFLGLCEDGFVNDVPPGRYTQSVENKAYAVKAAALLRTESRLAAEGPSALWKRVIGRITKSHNHQMDVVLALHHAGLLK
jgi:hypothetical protein